MTPKWLNGLRVQIVLLLSLALFPLGAVAVYQTSRVENESARNAEMSLLALTRSAAKEEELFIQRALGVARFFGTVASDFIEDPDTCVRDLRRFVARNQNYSFIGVLPPSGIMTCTSAGGAFDAKTGQDFTELMQTKRRTITANPRGPISRESIFNISEPFEINDEFAGFITISIPHRGMPQATKDLEELGLIELLTFNSKDQILSARNDLDNADQELPLDRSLGSLNHFPGLTFVDKNQRGESRTYTVVPIEGSSATVLGVWSIEDNPVGLISTYMSPAVFPILMWVASVAVAMLSIHTLVLRHIIHLRRNMDNFAETRVIENSVSHFGMPNELQALANNFDRMTDDIMREEAELEDMVREKNVLIKEVHHRVKNNLQLISSIMNMKIREAKHDETKSVLMRLQDRVLSLASIHRDLYQSQNGGRANAGGLVADIVESSVEIAISKTNAIEVETDFDPVLLYPDQAVPLALLVAEGMTNALKYLGSANKAKPFIRVSLKQVGTECVLTMENSVGDTSFADGTGLGAKLINAFSVQLGGEINFEKGDEVYSLTLRFEIEDFTPEGRDF
ncbi:sensor histidine kinase [Sulfitobacter sp. F26204]|uniref:sensor histidine kinase n=1 Tax=Sulfitobacter sp. F26204 TaxID=2996014 RepID=UPI00225E137D|nr:sensor histidine kinase [Sulfitobacter sp. F26204]MCX7559266.1 sensor histidine kinase [Sulfitobacter sp. F26204]